MTSFETLSPGSKAALFTSIGSYLKLFAEFYSNPLKQQPNQLKTKYEKLPFLISIADYLLKQAHEWKLKDYATGSNNVLENDYLKICFGYHEDLYHMLLLKACAPDLKDEQNVVSEIDFFQYQLDPTSSLPAIIALFLELHLSIENLDITYKTSEMLTLAFLREYTSSNNLSHASEISGDTLVLRWSAFVKSQIRSYDSELIATKVKDCRKKGNQFFKDKRYIEAVSYYTRGLSLNPNSYQLLCNRSAVYSAENLNESSVADLLKAVELHPSDVSAWARLAFNRLYTGSAVEALKDYNKAVLAAHGRIFPLHLSIENIDTYSKRDAYIKKTRLELNKKFLNKLYDGIKYSRSRAEAQGYPTEYLDDIMDPFVKEVYDKNLASLPSTSTRDRSSPNSRSTAPGAPQPFGQTSFNVSSVFPNVTTQVVDVPANFQQMFGNIQQMMNQSQSNGENSDGARQGLSVIGNIVNSLATGAHMAMEVNNLVNNAPSSSAGSLPPVPPSSNLEGRTDNPNTHDATTSDVDPDLDPDIDIDDVVQDAPGSTPTVNPSPVNHGPNTTVINGVGEIPQEIRDQINRISGSFFSFFGDRGRSGNDNGNSTVGNGSSNDGGAAEPSANNNNADAMEHDLD